VRAAATIPGERRALAPPGPGESLAATCPLRPGALAPENLRTLLDSEDGSWKTMWPPSFTGPGWPAGNPFGAGVAEARDPTPERFLPGVCAAAWIDLPVVHLGGWEHLAPWRDGAGLWQELADFEPGASFWMRKNRDTAYFPNFFPPY